MARFYGGCAVVLLAGLAVACTGKDPYAPGTPLGTFHVEATLKATTCGAAPNPWAFDVKLAHDTTKLYWIQGGAPIEGPIQTTTMKASLVSKTVETVRAADAKTQQAACTLARSDALDVVLEDAAGATVTDAASTMALSGTLTYAFAPGSAQDDCSDQVSSAGGDYDALPCSVTYAITAVRTKAPSAVK